MTPWKARLTWHTVALLARTCVRCTRSRATWRRTSFGYIDRIWEPFFGDGTVRVLTSEMSKMWPISDAGLGAAAYTFEFLMAWMGGKTRWRTMPRMVTFFFILVVPLGLTHIALVISQPVVVGAWCTLCLAAAAVMLVMIPYSGRSGRDGPVHDRARACRRGFLVDVLRR